MCGRYFLRFSGAEFARQFGTDSPEEFEPNYNIAPTQLAPILRMVDGKTKASLARWGLIPHWARDASAGVRMINARSETAATKTSFRDSFRQRRCLVPAEGFYEWSGPKGRRQAWLIRRGEAMTFGGLWETWRAEEGFIESFTILTTAANDALKAIHDRMPVIIDRQYWEAWLDPSRSEVEDEWLDPADSAGFELVRVSDRVNSVRFNDPECCRPI